MSFDELWKWFVGGVLSAGTGAFGYHKYIDGKISKKVDREDFTKALEGVHTELGRLRDNDGKLFDQIRESDQRAQDRHERLMERLTDG